MLFSTYKDLQPLVALFSISATTSGVYGDYNYPALRRLPRLTVVCRSSAKESHPNDRNTARAGFDGFLSRQWVAKRRPNGSQ
jgi:hypothetical protein